MSLTPRISFWNKHVRDTAQGSKGRGTEKERVAKWWWWQKVTQLCLSWWWNTLVRTLWTATRILGKSNDNSFPLLYGGETEFPYLCRGDNNQTNLGAAKLWEWVQSDWGCQSTKLNWILWAIYTLLGIFQTISPGVCWSILKYSLVKISSSEHHSVCWRLCRAKQILLERAAFLRPIIP